MRLHDLATLCEGVGRPLLYHGTTVERLYDILEADEISASTGHRADALHARDLAFRAKDSDARGYVLGVSLTRDPAFAHRWSLKKEAGVVLVLDAEALSHRHRVIPIAYWGGAQVRLPSGGPANSESEEFVIGAIRPLKRYLVEVRVRQHVLDAHDLLRFATDEQAVRLVVSP